MLVAPRVLVGVDLASVGRVTSLIGTQPGIEQEIFTRRELAYAGTRKRFGEHLAARFAAKEAVFKALGTGTGASMRWRDVEVINGASGRPRLRMTGAADRAAQEQHIERTEISLSHSEGMAIAFVAMTAADRDTADQDREGLI